MKIFETVMDANSLAEIVAQSKTIGFADTITELGWAKFFYWASSRPEHSHRNAGQGAFGLIEYRDPDQMVFSVWDNEFCDDEVLYEETRWPSSRVSCTYRGMRFTAYITDYGDAVELDSEIVITK